MAGVAPAPAGRLLLDTNVVVVSAPTASGAGQQGLSRPALHGVFEHLAQRVGRGQPGGSCFACQAVGQIELDFQRRHGRMRLLGPKA